ncbi:MAG: hypothetical protein ACO3MW_10890 [Rhodospirillales bacterium]
MSKQYNILIFGASYGSLLGAKLVLAGHNVKLLCLPEEADLINKEGSIVRLPVRGRDEPVELNSKNAPGNLSAGGTDEMNPSDYDLIGLAMQEPQYRSPGVKELLDKVAKSGVPCMSIMNMPPPPYLRRIPGLDVDKLSHCYTDASVWDSFNPDLVTLASPDAQAFRPPTEPINVLQVGLPTNFKVARFESDEHTQILHDLEAGIQAIRYDVDGEKLELPVKLRVHDGIFVPLAKWNMLLTGNYRCIQEGDEARAIKAAVHDDIEASKSVYAYVVELCKSLGADEKDLVPFDKYAKAALSLVNPSSAARAIYAGAPNIERVDILVQSIGKMKGMQNDSVDATVALVNKKLETNRAAAK